MQVDFRTAEWSLGPLAITMNVLAVPTTCQSLPHMQRDTVPALKLLHSPLALYLFVCKAWYLDIYILLCTSLFWAPWSISPGVRHCFWPGDVPQRLCFPLTMGLYIWLTAAHVHRAMDCLVSYQIFPVNWGDGAQIVGEEISSS